MNAKPVSDVASPAHNITNGELINHIEHEFPNLRGSLRELLKRFTDQCLDDVFESQSGNPNFNDNEEDNVVTCPKCGTELELSHNKDE